MSKKSEPTYEKVRQRLTDGEIAESFVLRSEMSQEEKQAAEEELQRLRMEKLKAMSDQQVLQSELMRMKLLLKDYIQQGLFLPEFSFASQLKKYIDLIGISHTQFAQDVHLHKTKLSRIVNAKESPNIDLMYRLEIHSGKTIPANYWYRLYSIEIENDIKSNKQKRIAESEKVKNELSFKRSA
ncbi:MAG: hypothetical protein AAFQ87_14020 [Bacteroidota bacterium]